MVKNSRFNKILEDLNDIPELNSEIESDDVYPSETILYESFSNSDESDVSNTDEEEYHQQKRRKIDPVPPRLIWEKMKENSKVGKVPMHNVFSSSSGPTGYAKKHIMKGGYKSAFSLIINHYIIEHIIKCSEAEAFKVLDKKWELSQNKLYAFLGLLYARGAYEANNLDVSLLWSGEWGPLFFSETMSRSNFQEIMRFIRFDKKHERSQRLKSNKFALISEIWDRFIENSQNCYKPGAYLTVDEQLFPTKTRCRFTQYMPNKPDKFGIKFWLASDVNSKYIINGFPYLGKDDNRQTTVPLGEFVVLKLMEPFTGCGRNVTMDNFFTSIPVAEKLLAKRTTVIGTIRKNKRDLPDIVKHKKDDMKRFSSQFYKSNHLTVTVYKGKPNKKVVILSSMHNSITIENNEKCLPETVKFYNQTKFGVDVTDLMARKYSVKSKSRRWPLQVFFNILDLAGINAWILYKETTGEKITRQDFLFMLAKELVQDYKNTNMEKSFLKLPPDNTSNIRKKCQIRHCNGNKATRICSSCKKAVCGKCTIHISIICQNCSEN